MIPAKIAGAFILALPLLILAWWFLRRQRPVFLMSVALILVGTGYLMATGATDDIANLVLGKDGAAPAATAPAPVVSGAPAAAPSEYPTK